jgi:hypothetical protein
MLFLDEGSFVLKMFMELLPWPQLTIPHDQRVTPRLISHLHKLQLGA